MLKTNHYFDGNVVSIGFQSASLPATVGVMAVGEYEFSTRERETMSVVSGALSVQLPGTDQWQTFQQGEQFVVDADQSFRLKVAVVSAYLCLYG